MRPDHILGVRLALLSWTCKINNQRIVCPLVLPQAGHAKKGAEAKGQQDELDDGLNLVNRGMYLDVNNADVSESIIGNALVYSVFAQCLYQFVHFFAVVFTVQRKPLPVHPHQNKAHSKMYKKHSKIVKTVIILIPNIYLGT